jgi:sporulation protein YlmC with PRC-barrel domain
MRRTTYYVFHSATALDLRGITSNSAGSTLPASDGPWTLEQQIAPDEPWSLAVHQSVAEFGILENGFYLWGAIPQHASSKPVIESDRVEGTAVYDTQGHRVGTIKRLLIEKVSGRVVYVDVTSGDLPESRGASSHRPLGEAHLRPKTSQIPHRHHQGAGLKCSCLLW